MSLRISLAMLLLGFATTSSAWIPHRSAVSPAVDAWSHSEACTDYCTSQAPGCLSASFDSFVYGGLGTCPANQHMRDCMT